MPEEDLHLSDHARSQAHRPSASAAWSFNFHLTTSLQNLRVETTDFRRVEFQFQPKQRSPKERLKLRLHPTKVAGLLEQEPPAWLGGN